MQTEMDEWTDRLICGHINGHRQTNSQTDMQTEMDEWTDTLMDGHTDGQTDKQTNEQMYGQTNGQIDSLDFFEPQMTGR
jgi:hypothetical protein